MSDMGFGYYGNSDDQGGSNNPASGGDQGPKWFRDKMEADAKAMKEMRDELNALRQQSQQAEVARVFQAQGFNPAAAALYQGDPTKAEEWLTANGSLLAKTDGGAAPQRETVPPGAPQSSLPAESQQGMAAMNAAGTDGTAQTLTGDDAIAAALRATNSPEEFQQVARAHGWNWDILS